MKKAIIALVLLVALGWCLMGRKEEPALAIKDCAFEDIDPNGIIKTDSSDEVFAFESDLDVWCDLLLSSDDNSVEFVLENGVLTVTCKNIKDEKGILKAIYIILRQSFDSSYVNDIDVNDVVIKYTGVPEISTQVKIGKKNETPS